MTTDAPLWAEIDARDWYAFVTSWGDGASAVVACGPDGAQRCYEADGETMTDALRRAMDLARAGEGMG